MSKLLMTRQFVMPNKYTFAMPPVTELLMRLVGGGLGWIDPFAGESSIAEYRNDLNPERPCRIHMEASEFVSSLDGLPHLHGALLDPPYSPRQIKESYDSVGTGVPNNETANQFRDVKDKLAHILPTGALAICFGWTSGGFGKGRGFQLEECHLLNHGGQHNDTIITVERKVQMTLTEAL